MLNLPTVWCERHLRKQEPWLLVLAGLLTRRAPWQAASPHLRAPPYLWREYSAKTEMQIKIVLPFNWWSLRTILITSERKPVSKKNGIYWLM